MVTLGVYNNALVNCELHIKNGQFVLVAPSDRVLQMVNSRLLGVVKESARMVTQQALPLVVVTELDSLEDTPPPLAPEVPVDEDEYNPAFMEELEYEGPAMDYGGCPSAQNNWTRVPNWFFNTAIVCSPTPSTYGVVAIIIKNTLGIVDYKGNCQDWWLDVSLRMIRDEANIGSQTTVVRAVAEARKRGFIKRRKCLSGAQGFDYALRWEWEPVDWP